MKSLGVLVLAGVFSALPAAAQFNMRIGSLGGPIGAEASSHPLGGFGPGFNGFGNRYPRNRTTRNLLYGYPYAYSIWVPDYFDYLDYRNDYTGPIPVPPDPFAPAPAAPQQPVIINQYFSGPPPQQQGAAPDANAANTSTQAPGDLIGTPQNYYLIAYKNHEVYSALAYWLEDKTLHYVTTQNTHNQASLDLIDLELTKTLNQRNDVPFEIPGQ